jgi:hypothetical protein
MNTIVERIEREAGVPGLATILAERLTPTDLQSILLEVYRLRSSLRKPSEVLADYRKNRFVRPSKLAPAALAQWEQIALAHLPQEFRAMALSPVCPLGTSSSIAGLNQNWVVSTTRNTEVVSDSTNVLALECAVQRQELLRADPKSAVPVHLAASHRLLRAQRFEGPDLVSHFSAFALCSAGRDFGSLQFDLAALRLQIGFFIQALQAFFGVGVPLQCLVSDFHPESRAALIEAELLSTLRARFENVDCLFNDQRSSGRGYYREVCFKIHATDASGKRYELADGGSVDWTQKLLSNKKERLIISGLGSERLVQIFEGQTNNLSE